MAPPSSTLEAELKYRLGTEVEKRFTGHEEKRRQEIKLERAKWFEKLTRYYRTYPVGADWRNGRPGGSPSELRCVVLGRVHVKRRLKLTPFEQGAKPDCIEA